jgi:hypothetical protein
VQALAQVYFYLVLVFLVGGVFCSPREMEYKRKFVKDPTKYLYVFTCAGSGVLGWSSLAAERLSGGEQDKMHALVIKDTAITGGSSKKYGAGDTLVHEIGHFFGLFHTFQGGCGDPGDGISDTPAEGKPVPMLFLTQLPRFLLRRCFCRVTTGSYPRAN